MSSGLNSSKKENERKSLLRRSHVVLPSTNLTQHIIQPWGGHQPSMGGHQSSMGGAISQVWGGHQPSMGGIISQVWGGHQPTMGGGHQPSMGGGIFPPVCTGSQTPENYFSNTYVLPSVNRTAGPTNTDQMVKCLLVPAQLHCEGGR